MEYAGHCHNRLGGAWIDFGVLVDVLPELQALRADLASA